MEDSEYLPAGFNSDNVYLFFVSFFFFLYLFSIIRGLMLSTAVIFYLCFQEKFITFAGKINLIWANLV